MNTHQEITLDLNADVVEWCPLQPHHRILAAGTYQLNEATQQRTGRLYLYYLLDSLQVEELCTHDLPGIFDFRWLPYSPHHQQNPILVTALADGTVRLIDFDSDTRTMTQQAQAPSPPPSTTSPSAMALSVECAPPYSNATGTAPERIASSFSDGSLTIFQVRDAFFIFLFCSI